MSEHSAHKRSAACRMARAHCCNRTCTHVPAVSSTWQACCHDCACAHTRSKQHARGALVHTWPTARAAHERQAGHARMKRAQTHRPSESWPVAVIRDARLQPALREKSGAGRRLHLQDSRSPAARRGAGGRRAAPSGAAPQLPLPSCPRAQSHLQNSPATRHSRLRLAAQQIRFAETAAAGGLAPPLRQQFR